MSASEEIDPDQTLSLRSLPEEMANSVTHGLGLVLSLVGAVALMAAVARTGDVWRIVGCGVYAATLVAVYGASTLSHVYQEPRRKRWFRMLDQAVIYLLIVGTYTPFSLHYFRGGSLWILLALMWAIAIAGFVSKLFFAHRIDSVSTPIYLMLGWLPLLGVRSILEIVPTVALWWMLAGGVCYTVGVLFLVLDTKVSFFHAVWHLLVIAGSVCHFVAIWRFVAGVGI